MVNFSFQSFFILILKDRTSAWYRLNERPTCFCLFKNSLLCPETCILHVILSHQVHLEILYYFQFKEFHSNDRPPAKWKLAIQTISRCAKSYNTLHNKEHNPFDWIIWHLAGYFGISMFCISEMKFNSISAINAIQCRCKAISTSNIITSLSMRCNEDLITRILNEKFKYWLKFHSNSMECHQKKYWKPKCLQHFEFGNRYFKGSKVNQKNIKQFIMDKIHSQFDGQNNGDFRIRINCRCAHELVEIFFHPLNWMEL